MILIPVTRVTGDVTSEGVVALDVPEIPPVPRRRTNGETLSTAIAVVPPEYRAVVADLHRQLFLGNFARFERLTRQETLAQLDRFLPDRGTLPGFILKSRRFNASGLALYNVELALHEHEGYRRLATVLSALIAGGWDRPQIELPPEHGDGTVPPQELPSGVFVEGAVRTIRVNAYERDRRARQACLDHFGYDCVCCGFNFERTYGPLGRGFIHVHHTVPLASIGHSYEVDPIRDLVPVCPNCHAIIHSPHPEPALSIAAMRELVALANHQTSGDVRQ